MYEVKIKTETPELGSALIAVLEELKRGKEKHPNYPENNIYRASIMMEEAGEVIRAVNQLELESIATITDVKIEIIQTAATCFRFLESIALEERKKEESRTKSYVFGSGLAYKRRIVNDGK